MTVHQTTSVTVVCAIGALLAGCGGQQASTGLAGSGAAGTSASRPPRGSTTAPVAPPNLTKTEALEFARAVDFTAADIPGATISRKPEHSTDPGERDELARCERVAKHGRALVETGSPRFVRGQELEAEEIRSYVTVVGAGRSAAREVALFASRSVRECVARVFSRRFAGETVKGATWGRVAVSPLAIQAPGADAAVGIRINATLTIPYNEVTVPIYADVLAFAIGPAEVAMSATSITQPVAAATEQQLLAVLLTRARTHAL